MPFQINDRVVHPAFGVGRIVGLTAKTLAKAESRMYYEVSGDKTTAWVQVDEGAARGLRPLTRKDELPQFRTVLRSRPAAMNTDFRQRQQEVRSQLKPGTLQCFCEVVRDLHGRSWIKTLNEFDLNTLRQTSDSLYQEWAAAEDVSLGEATQEVGNLLQEGRQSFAPPPPPAPVFGRPRPKAAASTPAQPAALLAPAKPAKN